MKPWPIALIAVLAAAAFFSVDGARQEGRAPAVVALDGDTIRATIRLANIDAPELEGACDAERDLAARATADIARRLATAKALSIAVDPARPFDRYGRVLALVAVDGVDLGQTLVAAGLAHVWRGSRAASGGWCP